MSQSIVPMERQVPDRERPEIGQVVRINRFEDLRAGTYWRAKEDVPELLKPQKRKRGVYLPEDHPDYRKGGGFGVNKIGEEEYKVDVPVRSACPGGRIHLVRSIKLVDGDMHAVVLQAHPSEADKGGRTYLDDEFLHFFEMVDEAEAEAVRAAEIAALQQEITDLQQAMIAGPPSEGPAALIGHQTKLPAQPTVGTMIANIDHIEKLQAGAERALAVAERNSNWITTHTKEIAARTSMLVPFFQERASAALASTEEVMRYAMELRKGVQSLGLYTGEGVELKRLREGESAPRGEPLTLERRMVFLDEEFLVNLDAEGRRGGADHSDFDDFVEAIGTDHKLRDRIFPFPRMVVLMRYRRTEKIYFEPGTIAGALANAAYNEPNRKQFLLIRDGENLWQCWSDLTTQEVTALYPTTRMGDAPFRGVDGSTIGLNDLNLSEAKGKFDDFTRLYKNLLILMWGLNDREGVFGPFYDPADWSPSGFIDDRFQAKYFRFRDPDADPSLGVGLPDFRTWVVGKNAWLRSGSRILVRKRVLENSEASGERNKVKRRQPEAVMTVGDGRAYEFVVRRTKKGHVMPVSAGRTVYPRDDRESYELVQTFDVPLDEEAGGYSEHGTLSWLCLDFVEAEEIDHYLNSRRDRTSYMEFYDLMLAARDQLREEAKRIDPTLARLEEAYAAAPKPLADGTTAHDLARHAVRLWRTANRGAIPPKVGSEAFPTFYKSVLSSMWTLAGNDHPVEAAEALAAAEGRTPIRLALTGKDRFALYATSVGDEIEDRLFPHVWVTRLACRRKGGGLQVTSRKVIAMPDAVADEEVLHDWDAIADWKGRDVPKRINERRSEHDGAPSYDHETIRKALATVQSGSLAPFTETPDDYHAAIRRLNEKRREITKGRFVADLNHVEPFAVIRTTAFVGRRVEGFESRWDYEPELGGFLVLALQDNAYRMIHRLADSDEDRETVVRGFVSQYERKDIQRDEFKESAHRRPSITASSLVDWVRAPEDPLGRDRGWQGVDLEANWAQAVRKWDVQRRPHAKGDPLWAPQLDEMLVWMHPQAPAILNGLCERFGWDPVPFVPSAR